MRDGQAGGQLDLTTPIKAFTDIVMRSAIQINVWKQGKLFIKLGVHGLGVHIFSMLRHEDRG